MIITKEQIEERAQLIFEHRVRYGIPGSPETDYKKAQDQLLAELEWAELTSGWELESEGD